MSYDTKHFIFIISVIMEFLRVVHWPYPFSVPSPGPKEATIAGGSCSTHAPKSVSRAGHGEKQAQWMPGTKSLTDHVCSAQSRRHQERQGKVGGWSGWQEWVGDYCTSFTPHHKLGLGHSPEN